MRDLNLEKSVPNKIQVDNLPPKYRSPKYWWHDSHSQTGPNTPSCYASVLMCCRNGYRLLYTGSTVTHSTLISRAGNGSFFFNLKKENVPVFKFDIAIFPFIMKSAFKWLQTTIRIAMVQWFLEELFIKIVLNFNFCIAACVLSIKLSTKT